MSDKIIESLPFDEFLIQEEERLREAARTRHPTPLAEDASSLTEEEKIEQIACHFHGILETLGMDLSHDSLQKTPRRVAKMFVKELFWGLDPGHFPSMTFMQDTYGAEENKSQTIFTSVSFISFCEHHFLPIDGQAFVAYRPKKKLIGLSKIPRIVEFFARRPQVQERLTAQIADCLQILLETEDVAIVLRAKHYCVLARGVEDHANEMTTQVLSGIFASDVHRKMEFFQHVHQAITAKG